MFQYVGELRLFNRFISIAAQMNNHYYSCALRRPPALLPHQTLRNHTPFSSYTT